MRLYRHLFKPSATLSKPYSMIGVPVIAAETDEAARFQATTQELKFLSLVRGNRLQLQPPVETWTAYGTNGNARRSNNDWARPSSAADTVKRKLEALVAETEADEVMIVSDFFDIRDRLRSFEIVASLKNGAGLSTRTGA